MRLDQLSEWAGDRLTISWRSFLLRPRPEERSVEAFTRYTGSWGRPAAMEPSITFNQWSGEHEPPSHSLPTSVAGKLAEQYGADEFDRFHHGLMEAYFTHNRTVSDTEVILDVAGSSGLPVDDFATRLADEHDTLVRAVIDDHNQAVDRGVGGVPAVVVNDSFPVTGAQDLDLYRRIVETQSAADR